VLPGEKDTICCPPPGHIGVYMKHLEHGLRFPLNEHLLAILKPMNVAIGQLMPLAIRTIVGFIWVCIWKGEAATVSLFRRLHHLQKIKKTWYSVVTEAGYVTVNPKVSSCKDWSDRFVFVRVPDDFPLPRLFEQRVNLRCEGRAERSQFAFQQKMTSAGNVFLNKDERRFLDYFKADEAHPKLCANWLPPTQIILRDEPLCLAGLIPALDQSKWGRYEAPFDFVFHLSRLLLVLNFSV
jgi:hypothetical protein